MTPEELAEYVKADIREHIAEGIIPDTVVSWEELDSCVDANTLGGMCTPGHPSNEVWDVPTIRGMQDIIERWLVARIIDGEK